MERYESFNLHMTKIETSFSWFFRERQWFILHEPLQSSRVVLFVRPLLDNSTNESLPGRQPCRSGRTLHRFSLGDAQSPDS